MTKGFITLATGDYYCWLAEHLYMTYKLYGNCSYPFYVITDKLGENRLSKLFDGVIVKENFTRTSVDKMCIFTDTPFDETIFIDSDCSIVNDVNYFFDQFEANGSDVSAIAGMVRLEEGKLGIQFGQKAIEAFDIKYDYPNFNGGVYYYKKSETGLACVDFMINHLLPNYPKYELMGRNNKTNMGDEPLVIVGMLKYRMKPIPVEADIMRLVHDPKTVRWNTKKRECSYQWYEYTVSPTIIHWKVGGTETYNFEMKDAIVRGQYNHQGNVSIRMKQIITFIKYKVYPPVLYIFPWMHKVFTKVKRRWSV